MLVKEIVIQLGPPSLPISPLCFKHFILCPEYLSLEQKRTLLFASLCKPDTILLLQEKEDNDGGTHGHSEGTVSHSVPARRVI